MTDFFGKAAPLTQQGFDETCRILGVDPPSLWSLMTVETRGFGFLPDRRLKILFERHIFYKRTQGRFSTLHPDISSSLAGGYMGGDAEYQRLSKAMALDARAALESASWGLGQIMGFNAVKSGYANPDDMVAHFLEGEDQQLQGTLRFIQSNPPLAKAFAGKYWDKVAFFYNGSSYARNEYDKKLERYFLLYTIHGTPSIAVRTAQAWLTYLGYSPRGVDGLVGDGTRTAAIAFQKHEGLPVTAELDDKTLLALQGAAAAMALH
jgi:hypothetical protein